MATTKERILITLNPDISEKLRKLSAFLKTPRATVAAQLIEYELFRENLEKYRNRRSKNAR